MYRNLSEICDWTVAETVTIRIENFTDFTVESRWYDAQMTQREAVNNKKQQKYFILCK